MNFKVVLRLAALISCILGQGCITSTVWQDTSEFMIKSQVQGFVRKSSGADHHKIDYVVVRFVSNSTWPRQSVWHVFAIPADRGDIPEIMKSKGSAHDYKLMIDSITKEQMESIRACFTPDSARLGKKVTQSADYVQSKAVLFGNEPNSQTKSDWGKNISLVPYRWSQPGVPPDEVLWWSDASYGDGRLDPRYEALMTPCRLPKKKSDYYFDVSLAVIETPFAVVLDAALLPLEFFYFATCPG